MSRFLSICFVLSCLVSHSQSVLVNQGWEFRNAGDVSWFGAKVPGTIHTDLFRNGVIDDPYEDLNELRQQWVGEKNWEYRNTFSLEKNILRQSHIELVFEGLDTYATVKLNGETILEANNMFRSWRIDITELAEAENTIEILFTSPIKKNTEKAKNYLPLPGGTDTSAYPVAPFTRKAAYHFGWDWAPRFVTMGIWKDVRIEAWSGAKIRNTFIQQEKLDDEKAELELHLEIESEKAQKVKIYMPPFIDEKVFVKKGRHTKTISFTIDDPVRWWPHTQGFPFLYNLDLSLQLKGKVLERENIKYGIRTVELVNKPDSIGTSFFFKVNGKPTFMKGANYVPQDVFLPRVKDSDYEELLSLAKDAGMNMIRVWGGGVYERDVFYDICDSLGILVWQDFMFAGTMYPADYDFVSNVRMEAEEQVKRLRNHPSLALWCGNNEVNVAWENWGWQKQYGYTPADSAILWQGYLQIFENTLPAAVAQHHPGMAYVPTSPQSNWGKLENFNHGSMHYWGVWHGSDDFSGFEKYVGRFMVEYGFQSFPNSSTLNSFVDRKHRSLSSPVMQARQKSYVGNGKIEEFVLQYLPDSLCGNFNDFIEKSQEVQGVGLEMAINAHIQKKPHCMGTLMWQLNDCWPGPSWSIIDYRRKPKKSYFSVKRAFQNH